jgi:hypothetical protein
LETKPFPLASDLPFRKYLQHTMKSAPLFTFQDISRVCRALGTEIQYKLLTLREGDADLLRTYFQQLYDRILVLTKDNSGLHAQDSERII